MEDNAGQIKILFLFHFTGVKEFHNNVFENLVSQTITQISGVYRKKVSLSITHYNYLRCARI